jgi:hypothetical protein
MEGIMITKTSDGYVEQVFDDNGKCISQRFVAVDSVEYTDEDGEIIEQRDFYYPFDMAQPEE